MLETALNLLVTNQSKEGAVAAAEACPVPKA
jgi:hypothetical protein